MRTRTRGELMNGGRGERWAPGRVEVGFRVRVSAELVRRRRMGVVMVVRRRRRREVLSSSWMMEVFHCELVTRNKRGKRGKWKTAVRNVI